MIQQHMKVILALAKQMQAELNFWETTDFSFREGTVCGEVVHFVRKLFSNGAFSQAKHKNYDTFPAFWMYLNNSNVLYKKLKHLPFLFYIDSRTMKSRAKLAASNWYHLMDELVDSKSF